MKLPWKRLAYAAACLGLSAGTAYGADLIDGGVSSYKDAPGSYWVVTIGGYGTAEPAFLGSKDFMASGLPILDVRRAGDKEWLTLPNDAFSIALYQTKNFRIGGAGDFLNDRQRGNNSTALQGIHNINYTVELGAFAEYYPVPFLRTRAELLQGVTGADGFAANLMADFIYQPLPQWLFTAGPRMQIVNDQYASAFYSINSRDAASGLSSYRASGGIDYVGVDASARYDLTARFSIRAFAEWDRLVADAANSPLIKQRGTADQVQVGLGAAYKFNYAW